MMHSPHETTKLEPAPKICVFGREGQLSKERHAVWEVVNCAFRRGAAREKRLACDAKICVMDAEVMEAEAG